MGVGESGIGSQQNVGNCNVFSTYGTAFEKPGLIQKFNIYQKEEDGGDGNAVRLVISLPVASELLVAEIRRR
ncbi:hypothetical protein, partial [Tychonema sp. BBK16]|uniref:hypothetical protein n=1 Tax=Tychonema sp. BBK16 TaxID=2699888 RepID=UPI001F3BF444